MLPPGHLTFDLWHIAQAFAIFEFASPALFAARNDDDDEEEEEEAEASAAATEESVSAASDASFCGKNMMMITRRVDRISSRQLLYITTRASFSFYHLSSILIFTSSLPIDFFIIIFNKKKI